LRIKDTPVIPGIIDPEAISIEAFKDQPVTIKERNILTEQQFW